jgi:hypothetical protein
MLDQIQHLKHLQNVHGLAASTSLTSGELQQKLTNAQMKAELEKEQFEEKIHEVRELSSLLSHDSLTPLSTVQLHGITHLLVKNRKGT